MRRSLTSDYYGKIKTLLLMNINGNSKELNFLTYVGVNQNKDALTYLFMQQVGVIWQILKIYMQNFNSSLY